jgi:hypothetical protein
MNSLNFIKSKSIWIICLLSFFTAFTYNEINLNKLPKEKIREYQTVITNDDNSYLSPAQNYLQLGEWKSDAIGKQAYFVRPPGYGIFYLSLLKLTNSTNTLLLLKLIQYLLFSFSIYWFYYIIRSLIKSEYISLIISGVYGLTPFAIGFLSYTLTEGITPALTLLFIYILFKANESFTQKKILYTLSALCLSYILIVRPQIGFIGILLPIFLVKEYYSKNKLQLTLSLILFGIISFSSMAAWQVRNHNITDNYTGLHSIYYPDNNSIYRPTLKEYWNFVGCWAQEGHIAHSYIVPMWSAATKGDTSELYIKNAIQTFPTRIINFYGKRRLTRVFRNYQKATLNQKKYLDNETAMPLIIPSIELEVIKDFKQLTTEYKKEFWLDYHIISPLRVFKTIAFHSNLSLHIFQHTLRGNWPMEAIRILFFGIHSLSFLGVFISLILWKYLDWKQTSIAFTLFIYILFLCYFQRGIEERYTLPTLPLLMISVVVTLNYIYNLINPQSRK